MTEHIELVMFQVHHLVACLLHLAPLLIFDKSGCTPKSLETRVIRHKPRVEWMIAQMAATSTTCAALQLQLSKDTLSAPVWSCLCSDSFRLICT